MRARTQGILQLQCTFWIMETREHRTATSRFSSKTCKLIANSFAVLDFLKNIVVSSAYLDLNAVGRDDRLTVAIVVRERFHSVERLEHGYIDHELFDRCWVGRRFVPRHDDLGAAVYIYLHVFGMTRQNLWKYVRSVMEYFVSRTTARRDVTW